MPWLPKNYAAVTRISSVWNSAASTGHPSATCPQATRQQLIEFLITHHIKLAAAQRVCLAARPTLWDTRYSLSAEDDGDDQLRALELGRRCLPNGRQRRERPPAVRSLRLPSMAPRTSSPPCATTTPASFPNAGSSGTSGSAIDIRPQLHHRHLPPAAAPTRATGRSPARSGHRRPSPCASPVWRNHSRAPDRQITSACGGLC